MTSGLAITRFGFVACLVMFVIKYGHLTACIVQAAVEDIPVSVRLNLDGKESDHNRMMLLTSHIGSGGVY